MKSRYIVAIFGKGKYMPNDIILPEKLNSVYQEINTLIADKK